jgi:rhodanese-related sulfurtransferase
MIRHIPHGLVTNRTRATLRSRLLLAGYLLFACLDINAAEKPYAPDSIPGAVIISAEQVAELILSKPDLFIIDSRQKSEFTKGHIEGAVNLLNTEMQREDLEILIPDKSTPILFYCNGERCLRSSDAIRKTLDWGYRNLFWFRGGWKEWTDKRMPVISE